MQSSHSVRRIGKRLLGMRWNILGWCRNIMAERRDL